MKPGEPSKPSGRSKPYTVSLGPELTDRLEAVRTSRRPAPPASAFLRLLVETALPSFEAAPAVEPKAA